MKTLPKTPSFELDLEQATRIVYPGKKLNRDANGKICLGNDVVAPSGGEELLRQNADAIRKLRQELRTMSLSLDAYDDELAEMLDDIDCFLHCHGGEG